MTKPGSILSEDNESHWMRIEHSGIDHHNRKSGTSGISPSLLDKRRTILFHMNHGGTSQLLNLELRGSFPNSCEVWCCGLATKLVGSIRESIPFILITGGSQFVVGETT